MSLIRQRSPHTHKTLDLIENLIPVSEELTIDSDKIQRDWQRFTRREMGVEEFRKLSVCLEEFLGAACTNANKVKDDMHAVMLLQDYQDLTGQILRKVINTVQDAEDKLVGVIRTASDDTVKTEESSNIEAEGPQINSEGKPNVMTDQDDVDDLPSNLGF